MPSTLVNKPRPAHTNGAAETLAKNGDGANANSGNGAANGNGVVKGLNGNGVNGNGSANGTSKHLDIEVRGLNGHAMLAPTARVLFVGATGRVGHQVVPILREKFAVTATAISGGEVAGEPVGDIDITDWASVERVVRAGDAQGRPFDAVVNCAIANSYGIDHKDPAVHHLYEEQCIDVNARGAYHVFEAAKRAGVPRVVYISSMTAVLGEPRYERIEADTLNRPRDIYAACKVFGENVGRTYAYPRGDGSGGMQVTCLRLGMPYPVLTGSDRMWQKNFGRRAVIVHMEDVAQAIRCALTLPPAVRYGIYTIVSHSDNPFVDPKVYAGLGYEPLWRFSGQGAERDGVLTITE